MHPIVENPAGKGHRLRRSCELCRNTKSRCLPSTEDGGRCQRCVRDEKQCLFLEAKSRTKKGKSSKVRVAEMEAKLDSLMDLISSGKIGVPVPATSQEDYYAAEYAATPVNEYDSSDVIPEFFDTQDTIPIPSKPFLPESPSIFDLFAPSERLHDVISKDIISFQEADERLQDFNSQTRRCQFIVIPQHMSLDILRRERPFLLLAILAFTTYSNVQLQMQLELDLRELLSRKLIVNREKSLDLLQGLIVYITCYHFFFDSAKDQVYQLCQMAAAMCIDLGLHRKMKSDLLSSVMTGVTWSFFHKYSEEDLDSRRTYVGCYYLTSVISQLCRKPDLLKHNGYLEECAQILSAVSRNETDSSMSCLLQMQRLSDEVGQTVKFDSNFEIPSLDSTRTEIFVTAFRQQLEYLETILSPFASSSVVVKTTYYRLKIYVHEIGFHASLPETNTLMSAQSSFQTWYYSTERNSCLMSCLVAIQEYFEYVVSLTDDEILDFGLVEFITLIYAVFMLGSFATCNDPVVDSEHFRKCANFEVQVTSLTDKIAQVVTRTRGVSGNLVLTFIGHIFERSLAWYVQLSLDPKTSETLGEKHAFMQILPTIMLRCADFDIFAGSTTDSCPIICGLV